MADDLARLTGVSAGYREHVVFRDLDLTLPRGRVVALCGPNGSGKSTALRVMRRLVGADAGEVEIAGRDVRRWSAKNLARAVAMLSQTPEAPAEMSVADLVMLGRYAHRSFLGGTTDLDRAAVHRAVAATELGDLVDRPLGQLSGGQLQRVWLAMTIAQESPVIFLDEPTNHLDLAHSLEILDLVRRLNRDEGRSFVIVLHDLNMAARYADHIVLFDAGRAVAQGHPREILTEERIAEVFDVRCAVIPHPAYDCPLVVPLDQARSGRAHAAE